MRADEARRETDKIIRFHKEQRLASGKKFFDEVISDIIKEAIQEHKYFCFFVVSDENKIRGITDYVESLGYDCFLISSTNNEKKFKIEWLPKNER